MQKQRHSPTYSEPQHYEMSGQLLDPHGAPGTQRIEGRCEPHSWSRCHQEHRNLCLCSNPNSFVKQPIASIASHCEADVFLHPTKTSKTFVCLK